MSEEDQVVVETNEVDHKQNSIQNLWDNFLKTDGVVNQENAAAIYASSEAFYACLSNIVHFEVVGIGSSSDYAIDLNKAVAGAFSSILRVQTSDETINFDWLFSLESTTAKDRLDRITLLMETTVKLFAWKRHQALFLIFFPLFPNALRGLLTSLAANLNLYASHYAHLHLDLSLINPQDHLSLGCDEDMLILEKMYSAKKILSLCLDLFNLTVVDNSVDEWMGVDAATDLPYTSLDRLTTVDELTDLQPNTKCCSSQENSLDERQLGWQGISLQDMHLWASHYILSVEMPNYICHFTSTYVFGFGPLINDSIQTLNLCFKACRKCDLTFRQNQSTSNSIQFLNTELRILGLIGAIIASHRESIQRLQLHSEVSTIFDLFLEGKRIDNFYSNDGTDIFVIWNEVQLQISIVRILLSLAIERSESTKLISSRLFDIVQTIRWIQCSIHQVQSTLCRHSREMYDMYTDDNPGLGCHDIGIFLFCENNVSISEYMVNECNCPMCSSIAKTMSSFGFHIQSYTVVQQAIDVPTSQLQALSHLEHISYSVLFDSLLAFCMACDALDDLAWDAVVTHVVSIVFELFKTTPDGVLPAPELHGVHFLARLRSIANAKPIVAEVFRRCEAWDVFLSNRNLFGEKGFANKDIGVDILLATHTPGHYSIMTCFGKRQKVDKWTYLVRGNLYLQSLFISLLEKDLMSICEDNDMEKAKDFFNTSLMLILDNKKNYVLLFSIIRYLTERVVNSPIYKIRQFFIEFCFEEISKVSPWGNLLLFFQYQLALEEKYRAIDVTTYDSNSTEGCFFWPTKHALLLFFTSFICSYKENNTVKKVLQFDFELNKTLFSDFLRNSFLSSGSSDSYNDDDIDLNNLNSNSIMSPRSGPPQILATFFLLLEDRRCVKDVCQTLLVLMNCACDYIFNKEIDDVGEESLVIHGSNQLDEVTAVMGFLQEYLFRRFIERISELNSTSHNSTQLATVSAMLFVLTSLLHKAKSQNCKMLQQLQVLLRECGAYVHLYNLLHNKANIQLCYDICDIFILLMDSNQESKLEFRELLCSDYQSSHDKVAYEPLCHIFLQAENNNPSLATITLLFNFMVDGKFVSNSEDVQMPSKRIHNPDALTGIFSLLPFCDCNVQYQILTWVQQMLHPCKGGFHILNRSICCSTHPAIMDQILDTFPSLINESIQIAAIEIMESIGSHSTSVRQLKRIFRLLQSSERTAAAICWRLISGLQVMISNFDSSGPSHYFFFDGEKRSGLQIPPLAKWPAAASGYSFCSWICVERPSPSSSHSCQSIYSFRDNSRVGITLGIHNENLVFYYYGKPKEDSIFSPTPNNNVIKTICINTLVKVQYGKWYFICVAHSPGSFRTQPLLKLYTNGKKRWQGEVEFLPWMNGSKVVKYCYIGAAMLFRSDVEHNCDKENEEQGEKMFVGMHLHGRMSAFYFLKYVIHSTHALELYHLGPNFIISSESSFSTSDVEHTVPLPQAHHNSNHAFATSSLNRQKSWSMDHIVLSDIQNYPNQKACTTSSSFENMEIIKTRNLSTSQEIDHISSSSSSCSSGYEPEAAVHRKKLLLRKEDYSYSKLPRYIVLSYNPSVWEGNFFLDNTPEENLIRVDLRSFRLIERLHARRLEGTYDIETRNIANVMNCIGGIQVIFPLFAQFDFAASDGHVENRLIPNILSLIQTLILHQHNRNTQIFMHEKNGFVLISYLLSRISPKHMTHMTLHQIEGMTQCSKGQIVKHILAEFKLWIYTPFDVQIQVLTILYEELLRRQDLRQEEEICTFIKLLNDLQLLYWYVPPDNVFSATMYDAQECMEDDNNLFLRNCKELFWYQDRQRLHPLHGHIVGRRPNHEECKQLRILLFRILKLVSHNYERKNMVSTSLDASYSKAKKKNTKFLEVVAIVQFLAFNSDPLQCIDMLKFLFEAVQQQSNGLAPPPIIQIMHYIAQVPEYVSRNGSGTGNEIFDSSMKHLRSTLDSEVGAINIMLAILLRKSSCKPFFFMSLKFITFVLSFAIQLENNFDSNNENIQRNNINIDEKRKYSVYVSASVERNKRHVSSSSVGSLSEINTVDEHDMYPFSPDSNTRKLTSTSMLSLSSTFTVNNVIFSPSDQFAMQKTKTFDIWTTLGVKRNQAHLYLLRALYTWKEEIQQSVANVDVFVDEIPSVLFSLLINAEKSNDESNQYSCNAALSTIEFKPSSTRLVFPAFLDSLLWCSTRTCIKHVESLCELLQKSKYTNCFLFLNLGCKPNCWQVYLLKLYFWFVVKKEVEDDVEAISEVLNALLQLFIELHMYSIVDILSNTSIYVDHEPQKMVEFGKEPWEVLNATLTLINLWKDKYKSSTSLGSIPEEDSDNAVIKQPLKLREEKIVNTSKEELTCRFLKGILTELRNECKDKNWSSQVSLVFENRNKVSSVSTKSFSCNDLKNTVDVSEETMQVHQANRWLENIWNIAFLIDYQLNLNRSLLTSIETNSNYPSKWHIAKELLLFLQDMGILYWVSSAHVEGPILAADSWLHRNSPKGGMLRIMTGLLTTFLQNDFLYLLENSYPSAVTPDSLCLFKQFCCVTKFPYSRSDRVIHGFLYKLVKFTRTFVEQQHLQQCGNDAIFLLKAHVLEVVKRFCLHQQVNLKLKILTSMKKVNNNAIAKPTVHGTTFLNDLCCMFGMNFTWSQWEEAFKFSSDQEVTWAIDVLHSRQLMSTKLLSHFLLDEFSLAKCLHVPVDTDILYKAEEKRLQLTVKQKVRERHISALSWRRILRTLANERGPWGSKKDYPSNKNSPSSTNYNRIEWKLDFSENHGYLRKKLKRNHDHSRVHYQFSNTFATPDTSTSSNSSSLMDSKDHLNDETGNFSPSSVSLPSRFLSEAQFSLANELLHARALAVFTEREFAIVLDEFDSSIVEDKEDNDSPSKFNILQDPTSNQPPRTSSSCNLYDEFEQVSAIPPSVVNHKKKKQHSLVGQFDCEVITPVKGRPCFLKIYTKKLVFIGKLVEDSNPAPDNRIYSKSFNIEDIRQIYFRRYHFRPCALEVWFQNGKNLFINCLEKKIAKEIANWLKKLSHNTGLSLTPNPRVLLGKMELTDKWVRREITNFEYLMHLNVVAGRTQNDLAQYPIFPWILSDYNSSKLDLTNPRSFRNLSRPMGVQNESSVQNFVERYRMLDEEYKKQDNHSDDFLSALPAFHYGTHYSCAGFVISFLIRMEPFTSLHASLQGGKIDHADRLFHSIAQSYQSCSTNASDVRELIPEFFYLPEMFRNTNNIHFGRKQTGEMVDNVVLPPWCNNSPEEFIRLHRLALESDYVSQNLHHWIDLIFGYKQRGKEAVDAHNVFFHLTYCGAVDLDKLWANDRQLYNTTISQIDCYGQTPTQIFFKPHPSRDPCSDLILPLFSRNYMQPLVNTAIPIPPCKLTGYPAVRVSRFSRSLLFIAVNDNEKMYTIDSNRSLGQHRWKALPPDAQPPFFFRLDQSLVPSARGSVNNNINKLEQTKKELLVGAPFATRSMTYSEPMSLGAGTYGYSSSGGGDPLSSFLFALHPTGTWLFSCGHWDHSIRVTSLEHNAVGNCIQAITHHQDVVTCLKISQDGDFLVSGSNDTTITVWKLRLNSEFPLESTPLYTLYGHDDGITCVDISISFNLVLSSSKDGTLMIHTLYSGKYVRSILTDSTHLSYCGITSEGLLISYAKNNDVLNVYSINGKVLNSTHALCSLYAFVISKDGSVLITGGKGKNIFAYNIFDLSILLEFNGEDLVNKIPKFRSNIQSISISNDEMHLFVGLACGELCIYTLDAQYLRNRLQRKLANLGF